MAAWSGELPFYQQESMTHRCDLWEPHFGADGTATTYTLHTTGIPALRTAAASVDDPEVLALIESSDLQTVDQWRLPINIPLESSWLLLDRSTTGSLNYNRGWKTLGSPISDEDWSPAMRSGVTDVYATKIALLPVEIREHYGLPEPGAG